MPTTNFAGPWMLVPAHQDHFECVKWLNILTSPNYYQKKSNITQTIQSTPNLPSCNDNSIKHFSTLRFLIRIHVLTEFVIIKTKKKSIGTCKPYTFDMPQPYKIIVDTVLQNLTNKTVHTIL